MKASTAFCSLDFHFPDEKLGREESSYLAISHYEFNSVHIKISAKTITGFCELWI